MEFITEFIQLKRNNFNQSLINRKSVNDFISVFGPFHDAI